MSFSGDIEDVSVADTLQFIHLGGRSGTLSLSYGSERAEISFHHGRIVRASGPKSKRLGDLLLEAGAVSESALESALRTQGAVHPRRSLGQILISTGTLDADVIYRVLEQQIRETVRDLLTWSYGSFEFALDELRPVDEVGVNPGDIVNVNVDTHMVLLDALRLFDEKNRTQQSSPRATATPAAGAPRVVPRTPSRPELPRLPAAAASAAVAPPRLQVVSSDPRMVATLKQSIKAEEATVVGVTLRDAGTPPPGEASPVVLLDFRQGGVALEALKALRRSRPRSSVIAVVDASISIASVYDAGAIAVVGDKPQIIASCFRSTVQNRADLWTGGMRPDRLRENYAKLRRIVGDLRSGLISTTISLSLMNIISESVERAVLFLVRHTELVALGAFGTGQGGEPLADLTRGLRLPIDGTNAAADSLGDGQVRSLPFEKARFPDSFKELLGRPRTGECAIFPVLGGQKVIAVVYADNGFSNTTIEQVEILELAAVQAGLALENELLRRQMGQNRPDPPRGGH